MAPLALLRNRVPCSLQRSMRQYPKLGVIALVAVLAACSSTTHRTSAPTTVRTASCTPSTRAGKHEFAYGGLRRTYRVALPADQTPRHPLLLALHGFASSSTQFDRETGLDKQGTDRGYVVVTPDAAQSPTNWNIFGAPNQPNDFGFINALLKAITPHLCVDTSAMFAVGHSAGSAFAGFLVCKPPYRFVGVAMVEATVPSTCPARVRPAVVSIHATGDPVVLYNGGLGIGQTVPIPPVRQTVAQLAHARGCAKAVDKKVSPFVTERRYAGCKPGSDVALYTIHGGGHLWAPGDTSTILDFFDSVGTR
jgi:polyhydroxybutyrate depolymerase